MGDRERDVISERELLGFSEESHTAIQDKKIRSVIPAQRAHFVWRNYAKCSSLSMSFFFFRSRERYCPVCRTAHTLPDRTSVREVPLLLAYRNPAAPLWRELPHPPPRLPLHGHEKRACHCARVWHVQKRMLRPATPKSHYLWLCSIQKSRPRQSKVNFQ